ncbi:autotransporter assembly complex family protein [Solidesulfovibrio sp.]|uniref:autotransporter assembly complex protein TamA n=1 Tax=Solidesulfovibrio sp. TaxID=2910990 RepID=UPI002B1ED70E|nr:autotransporter assembly complex family protein [Solidesulfovibrio sp.]MEA4856410.1 autotransporter assembly complex family protein [Solidesulfovibrio sp.]
MGIIIRLACAVVLALALCGPALAPAATRTAPARTPAGLAYVVRFSGDIPAETLDLLRQVSKAETLIQNPPDSILLLERRAEEDKANFAKVFQSDGYFAATIAAAVDQSATPAVLTYAVTPGPRFTLRQATLEPPGPDLPTPADIGLTVPSPFSAKAVVDAEAKITDILHRKGHPYAKVANRRVTADFGTHDVAVVWDVEAGPRATFGPARFSGLATVKEGYLAGLVPWAEGAPYDADLVTRFRKKLVSLDLFTLVAAEPAPEPDPDGRVPVLVTLAERKHRTIKGGVDYKTDEGPGANLGWEHRNLFGGGEKLSVAASASSIEQFGEASFEKPDFITPKELFKARGKIANENKKAYEGQNAQATGSIRRQFTDSFSAAAGLGYRASRIIKDQSRPWEDDKRYGFVFLPVEAGYDTRNDVLDPQKGLQATVSAAPYWGTLAGGPNFVRPEFSLANYFKLADKPGLVLATRVIGGANIGTDRDNVSPDLRYYAGGSGSIRGYPYQTVGPLRGNTPVGGGSLLTFSAELRFRVTELIGIVPFVDGGSAFINPLPPYNQPILLGAGLGVRIYTPVGPVRLDVATPVTPRKDIDDIAQFYVSIGQSF